MPRRITAASSSTATACSATSRRAYVTSRGAEGTLSVIFLEDERDPVVVPTGPGAEGLAVSPDGGEVWVANRDADTLSVVDTETFEVVATLEAHPDTNRVEMTASGLVLAPNASDGGAVAVYDLNTRELLRNVPLREAGSELDGHPNPMEGFPFFDAATGSLGQGLPISVGVAYAGRYFDRVPFRVWCLTGDSEMAEGSMWEAFQHAGWEGLDNLVAIVDVNVVPDLEQYRLLNQAITEWGGMPVINLAGTPMTEAERHIKATLDRVGALVLIGTALYAMARRLRRREPPADVPVESSRPTVHLPVGVDANRPDGRARDVIRGARPVRRPVATAARGRAGSRRRRRSPVARRPRSLRRSAWADSRYGRPGRRRSGHLRAVRRGRQRRGGDPGP